MSGDLTTTEVKVTATRMVPKRKLTQPLKWHGGKHYLADQILALMPKHLHYVEPYFGGGAVLLNKDPEGVSEVVNDIDRKLTNFWRALQDERSFRKFHRVINATPFSQVEWKEAADRQHPTREPDVHAAIAFFICCRQSRAGKFDCFATLSRNRTRRAMNEQASAWLTAVEGLLAIAVRLKRVVILNMNATDVIAQQDGPNTLFYLDPPYLHETRVSTANYRYEMTPLQHRQLLATIKECKGMVLLSGYPNTLYDKELRGWNRRNILVDNKSSSANKKPIRTEHVWMNF